MQVKHKDGTEANQRISVKIAQDMHATQDPEITGEVGQRTEHDTKGEWEDREQFDSEEGAIIKVPKDEQDTGLVAEWE